MSEQKKVYGLIIPKKGDKDKKKTSALANNAFNVFGDDQDSDEGEKTKGPVGPYGYTKTNTKLKLQSQMDIEKAMQDDPTVYEYDEIYDDIQATKPQLGKTEETKSKKKQKPQYIAGLLKAAEVKKKENERRNERKVQKERDEEGEKFADKEAFVTSAYKQKMLDMQKEAEEERRKEAMEEMTDVTKQKDLGGFYRYLYHQKTATETEEKRIKEEPQEVTVKTEPVDHVKKELRQRSSSPSDSEMRQPASQFKARQNQENTRKFRKRKADSSSGSESEDAENNQKHIRKKDDRRTSEELGSKTKNQDNVKSKDSKRYREREKKRRHNSSSSSSSSSRSKSRSPVDKRRRSRSESRSRSKSSVIQDKTRKEEVKTKTVIENIDKHREKNRSSRNEGEMEADRKTTDNSELHQDKSPLPNKNIAHENKPTQKCKPVDPKDRVYPHHNSPADIEAARKRYLIRKLEREKNRGL